MHTRFIGLKDLRQNMAKVSTQARKRNERVIVLRKNKPVFELLPLSDEASLIESFRREIEQARANVKSGQLHTQGAMERALGL